MERSSRSIWIFGLLAFVLPMAAYWSTLCPTVFLHPDSAEFATAAAQGGVPQPCGYPTYMLLARTVLRFAPGEVARSLNAMSAVFGALAIWGVFLCLRLLIQRDLPALLAALALAAVPSFWRLSVITEVYSLHAFLLSMQLFFLLRYRQSRGRAHLAFFALFFALGLGNHPTTLFALLAFFFLLLAERHCPEAGSFLLAVGIVLVVTGGLYLSLPFAQSGSNFENPWIDLYGRDLGSPSGFLWYVTGRPFSHMLFAQGPEALWTRTGEILQQTSQEFDNLGPFLKPHDARLAQITAWLPLLLVLVGAFCHFRGQASSFFLIASLLACYLLFYGGLQAVPDQETFTLPVHMLFVFWVAVAFKGLLVAAERRPGGGRGLVVLLYVIALCDVAALAHRGWLEGGARDRREGSTWIREAGERLPEGAVVLADSTSYWLLRYGRLTDRRLAQVKLFPYGLATRAMWQGLEEKAPAERLLAIRDRWHRIVDIMVNTVDAQVFTTMPNLSSLRSFGKTKVGAGLYRLEKSNVPTLLGSVPEKTLRLQHDFGRGLRLCWLRPETPELRPGEELRFRLGWQRKEDSPVNDAVVTLLITPHGENRPLRLARFGHPFVFHRLGHGHGYLASWSTREFLEEKVEIRVPDPDSPLAWAPGRYDLWLAMDALPGTNEKKAQPQRVWTFSVESRESSPQNR